MELKTVILLEWLNKETLELQVNTTVKSDKLFLSKIFLVNKELRQYQVELQLNSILILQDLQLDQILQEATQVAQCKISLPQEGKHLELFLRLTQQLSLIVKVKVRLANQELHIGQVNTK